MKKNVEHDLTNGWTVTEHVDGGLVFQGPKGQLMVLDADQAARLRALIKAA